MDGLKTLFNKEINPSHWSPKSIPDLSNRVFVCTGGNAGIGYQTVLELAKHSPKHIFLTARSRSKFDGALEKIKKHVPSAGSFITYIELDLSSFASTKRAADAIINATDYLDVLINNAGIMGAPVQLTEDGYETHFGTNHMGHALLTKLLMPLLLKTAEQNNSDVRIINVGSAGQMGAPRSGFDVKMVKSDMKTTQMMTRYGQSKLANTLHARQLAKEYPSITCVSVHPGRVGTGLLDDMYTSGRNGAFGKFQKFYDWTVTPLSEERGAWTQLWAATVAKDKLNSGDYYVPIGKVHPGVKQSRDAVLAKRLWDWQEAEFAKLGYA